MSFISSYVTEKVLKKKTTTTTTYVVTQEFVNVACGHERQIITH